MNPSLAPQEAWAPLPASDWNAETARHLLRRAGWTARPDDVARAVSAGLPATLARLFPDPAPALPKPRLVARYEATAPDMQRNAGKGSTEERQRAQRELQDRSRVGLQELSLRWLEYAAQPESAAAAKWVLFLSDVYVISAEKVRNPAVVHRHFEILGEFGFGPAPALAKAVSRSPAMVVYLDLAQSQLKAPNENFARELFELFVLGEGNYTEADIKEAARAFTGYRVRPEGGFRFDDRQHDKSVKTVFGTSGAFSGDDVIDLAFNQPAAATYLPRELAKFYLCETPLPAAHLAALGDAWRADALDLRALQRRFFGSRLFFAPEFRGNLIKCPVQYLLGLVQDWSLAVAPLPRLTLTPLRQMGQVPFQPPNVRGWVGGRQWINSATIAARRQLAETLFAPLDENSLNADELLDLVAARTNGAGAFTVPDDAFARFRSLAPDAAVAALAADLLPGPVAPATVSQLSQYVAAGGPDPVQRLRRLRRAAVTRAQSPAYQLC